MSNPYLEKFKNVCLEISKVIPEKEEVKKPLQDREPRYNLHRRSLPVGLDKPVAFFLTKHEADTLMKRLKTKLIEPGKVIYYDLVLNTGENASVYFNDGKVTKPEGSDIQPIEIVHGWIG